MLSSDCFNRVFPFVASETRSAGPWFPLRHTKWNNTMATGKNFKRHVRERAAKTGERYTTARMHLLNKQAGAPSNTEQSLLGGTNPDTSALRTTLAGHGIRISEAMLLAAGGGIGAGYLAITHGQTGFMLGSRSRWWEATALIATACEGLGLELHIAETSSAKAGLANLQKAIQDGAPAMVWLDQAWLPYSPLPPQWRKGGYHVLAVTAIDADANTATLHDVYAAPFVVSLDDLAMARASITSYKHRVAGIHPNGGGVDEAALAKAALAGLRRCAAGLVGERARTFRLDGFEAWGKALKAASGKEAWGTLFTQPTDIARALSSTYRFVEHWGGPALLRPLFAQALRESSELLDRPHLGTAAELYEQCARLWHAVADAALPDTVKRLGELRRTLARCRAELNGGTAAIKTVQGLVAESGRVSAQAREAGDLSPENARAIFNEMATHVLAAHAAEVEAHTALEAALQ